MSHNAPFVTTLVHTISIMCTFSHFTFSLLLSLKCIQLGINISVARTSAMQRWFLEFISSNNFNMTDISSMIHSFCTCSVNYNALFLVFMHLSSLFKFYMLFSILLWVRIIWYYFNLYYYYGHTVRKIASSMARVHWNNQRRAWLELGWVTASGDWLLSIRPYSVRTCWPK